MHFAGVHIEANAIVRQDARKALDDVAHLDTADPAVRGLRRRVHGCTFGMSFVSQRHCLQRLCEMGEKVTD
jgi:hypothetical protein